MEILPVVLDRGLPAALLIVLAWFLFRLANDAAGILAETYTRPVADTAARTIANWIAVVAAIVMSRWTPGTLEALKVQLEYLDCYQDDGSTGFKLIRQAVDFALFRIHGTAKAEDTVVAECQLREPAEPSVTTVRQPDGSIEMRWSPSVWETRPLPNHPLLQDRERLEMILDLMFIQIEKVTRPLRLRVGEESPDDVLTSATLALLSYPPSRLATTWEALAVGIARNKAKDAVRRATS